jgi:PAS domain S-box-containing protein
MPTLGRRLSLEPDEYFTVLELLPQAAVIFDTRTYRPVYTSEKARLLTGYSPTELAQLDIRHILSGWDFQVALQLEQAIHILRPDGSFQPALAKVISIQPKKRRAILILEALIPQEDCGVDPAEIWPNFQILAAAYTQENIEKSIHAVLKAGQALTGADLLAVYKASENQPCLVRCLHLGDGEGLPDQIPAQDFAHLQKPILWEQEKRTSSSLHRTARLRKYAYLASTPLGSSPATIGLVVAAHTSTPSGKHVLPVVQILASTLTNLLEQEMRISSLQDRLNSQETGLVFAKTLENAIQEGLVFLSPDLLTLRLNPAAEIILGYRSSETLNHPAKNFLVGADNLIPALLEALNGDGMRKLGNVRLYRRNGQFFLADVRILPIRRKGINQGLFLLIQDLSEQEQAKEHTQQLEQRAILGEVTSIFAHEVRNPINNISTGLEVLGMSLPEEDPQQETIARLVQDCDRLEELMKSVLSFSRPVEYDMEPLDLGLVLQRMLDRLQPRMTRFNVQYHMQVEENCPKIEGNTRALEQVFTNLVNNASQAMSRDGGGHLAIKVQASKPYAVEDGADLPDSAEEERTFVEISVADTGPGIPKDLLDRIFQPFFTTKGNGSGLGLAISRRIIAAHKGTINVSSVPGATVFTVRIPAIPAQGSSPQPTVEPVE